MQRSRVAWVGVDPGITGAWGVIFEDGQYSVHDMPLTAPLGVAGGFVRRTVDGKALHRMMTSLGVEHVYAVVERVASRPGQGVASVFSLGYSLGAAETACRAAGQVVDLVSPQRWKGAMGIAKERGVQEEPGAGKERSLALARQLFPDAALGRKKDHNRAEALLIAEFCRRSNPLNRHIYRAA